MNHLFVSYELALKLKEKGFDDECLGWIETDGYIFLPTFVRLVKNTNCHGSNCAVPTYQQVVDWLREKHDINIIIDTNVSKSAMWYYALIKIETNIPTVNNNSYTTYYDALDKAIEETLELV